ncbi:acetate--CoA ligase [Candidatus Micrarchaeota archaeon CG08_land_8_20_14_0_20_59_11]|nr:MAG: acetate--CoA ligase [Candidatus Micrarchaeota archaeon CG08_land_8_20_14_0_20_59_11]
MKLVIEDAQRKNVFWPSEEMKKRAWVSDPSIYEKANKDPASFWAKLAEEGLHWDKRWESVYEHSPGVLKWFSGGRINASYNALDRHVKAGKKDKTAMIWVPEPTDQETERFTYGELLTQVNKFANVLKKLGVGKGDRVGIYLPMIPEVTIAILACARLGAPHTVVFSAFSGKSLNDRLIDGGAKVLVTADGYYRRGKPLDLKVKADEGVAGSAVEKVVVVKRTGLDVKWNPEKDAWWHELMEGASDSCEPESIESNELLFLLYTSGTTGKPKGIMHGTGGYLAQAYWTTKWDFNLHDDDVMWCTADIGWITGHTYGCYGPLLTGSTMLLFEGAPDYPDPGRFWKTIEENKVTVFYTAPTAIRMFVQFGDEWPKKYDLSSLRLLGTVGEPIDEDTWLWYFEKIGGRNCPVIDTWWQTETGGALINSLPGIGPFVPTVSGRSFPGVLHAVVDADGAEVQPGENGFLVQRQPVAPGMLKGVYKNPEKHMETYWSRFGPETYDTSDGAKINGNGAIRITGRVDDVMKVAGHRLSSAEVENAIAGHELVMECAVVPKPDSMKGEVPIAFVVLRDASKASEELKKELVKYVADFIGPTAKPSGVYFVHDVPKTRSGKIMRRVLRGIVRGEEKLGDLTTLINPECVDGIKAVVQRERQ